MADSVQSGGAVRQSAVQAGGDRGTADPHVEANCRQNAYALLQGVQELPGPGCGYRAQPCGYEGGRSVLGTEVCLHPALPDWAKTRIRAAPEAVDTEADLWRMLYQHEPVDEKGSGRMFQMAAASTLPSAASSHLEKGWLQLPTEDCCLPCDMPSYEEFQQWRPDVQRALFALMASNGKLLKCWRCQGNHRISTCLATPSLAEQQGQHFSTWPDVTPVGSSTPLGTGPPHPARPSSAPTMYVRPTINALPENSPDAVGQAC